MLQKWQHFVLKSKPCRYLSSVYTFYHAHGKSLHFDRETQANIKLVHCAWFSDEFGTTYQRQILDARQHHERPPRWQHQMHPSATHETGQVAGGKRPLPQNGENSVGPTEKLCRRMHVPRVAANVGKSIRNATSPSCKHTQLTIWLVRLAVQLWRQEDLFDWLFKRIPGTTPRQRGDFLCCCWWCWTSKVLFSLAECCIY